MDDKNMRDALEIVRERLEERGIDTTKVVIIGGRFSTGFRLPSFAELEARELACRASFLELEEYARKIEHEHPEGNTFVPRNSRQEVTHGKTNSWPTPKRRGRK